MNNLPRAAIFIAACAVLAACSASNPPLTGRPKPPPPVSYIPPKPDPEVFPKEFTFHTKEFSANQARYDENHISMLFTVNKDGGSVNELAERDFRLTENGVPITNFKLASQTQREDQIAEIAFAVDITGSMGPFINSAKRVLTDFIYSSRKKGYHVRMCLSTFGDRVVSPCRQFYDNGNGSDVRQFIDELTRISIHRGQAEYPGELDWEENPMRALVETASAPWANGSKRFVILVTDADFYSPEKPSKHFDAHQRRADTAAPTLPQTRQAIRDAQMEIFAVTPPAPGYNTALGNIPGITQTDDGSFDGEWFEFEKVIRRQITLDSILERILHRINTTYQVNYVVEKNPGLNPTLPLTKRQLQITTPSGQVSAQPPTSSVPAGREAYKQEWTVAEAPIKVESVFRDGKIVDPSEYEVAGGKVRFKRTPAPGAQHRIVYSFEEMQRNLGLEPMLLPGDANSNNTKVYLNGKETRPGDVTFSRTIEGKVSLNLNPATVLGPQDSYDIVRNRGLKIRVVK